MSIGKRLKEERKRLRMTQEEMGTACGLSKWAQLNFEKDENVPGGAYLLAALSRGVDLMYVLTGQRSQLDAPEAALVAAFRAASTDAQAAALAALGGASAAPSTGPKIKIKRGDVGQITTVAGDLHQENSFSVGKKKRS
jgi:transcriptional regulator with XRE-family HTH domain